MSQLPILPGTVFQLSPDYVSADGKMFAPGDRAIIGEIAGYNTPEILQAHRIKNCGLVFREDQSDSRRWVEPAPIRHEGRIKTLPLFMAQPKPGLEVQALDGERYLIPKNFKGTWFDVRSPKGKELIP